MRVNTTETAQAIAAYASAALPVVRDAYDAGTTITASEIAAAIDCHFPIYGHEFGNVLAIVMVLDARLYDAVVDAVTGKPNPKNTAWVEAINNWNASV